MLIINMFIMIGIKFIVFVKKYILILIVEIIKFVIIGFIIFVRLKIIELRLIVFGRLFFLIRVIM